MKIGLVFFGCAMVACGGRMEAAPSPSASCATAPSAAPSSPTFSTAAPPSAPPAPSAPPPSASSSSSSAPPPPPTGGPGDYCATAPWTDSPVQFVSASGGTILPAGMFTLRYVGGAQSHDEYHAYGGAFEVTAHYTVDGIQAGHHLFDGPTLDASATNIWLDDTGLVADLPSVDAVEQANAGHTWTIQLAGGPLWVTYLDNAYGDNIGPGTRLCIDVPPMG